MGVLPGPQEAACQRGGKTGVNPHSLPGSFADETVTAHDPAWASHLPRCPWPGGLTPYAGMAVAGEHRASDMNLRGSVRKECALELQAFLGTTDQESQLGKLSLWVQGHIRKEKGKGHSAPHFPSGGWHRLKPSST